MAGKPRRCSALSSSSGGAAAAAALTFGAGVEAGAEVDADAGITFAVTTASTVGSTTVGAGCAMGNGAAEATTPCFVGSTDLLATTALVARFTLLLLLLLRLAHIPTAAPSASTPSNKTTSGQRARDASGSWSSPKPCAAWAFKVGTLPMSRAASAFLRACKMMDMAKGSGARRRPKSVGRRAPASPVPWTPPAQPHLPRPTSTSP